MNEKREIRKEILLLPSEFEQFTAAANASGLPLTTWLVQAAREKLAREKLASENLDKFLHGNLNKQR